jgi:hypothetical protein
MRPAATQSVNSSNMPGGGNGEALIQLITDQVMTQLASRSSAGS